MRSRPLAAIALAGAVIVFWATRIAWPRRAIFLPTTDIWTYFYPTYHAFYGAIRAGTLPLWNPYVLCGLPWLPTLQGGFFYPPHVLYVLLPTYVALATSALLHLLLAGCSMAACARRLGLPATAALLAAMLFALRGTMRFWMLWPNVFEAAAWLPLGALAVHKLSAAPSARAVALLGATTAASLLAGYPQATLFLVYAWATLLAALLLGQHAQPSRWARAGGGFLSALLLGAACSAVHMLPALELAAAGTRGLHTLTAREMYTAVGTPYVDLSRRFLPGTQTSFGLVASVLVPAALWVRPRALTVWALAVGALALVLATGPRTTLFELYLSLPGLGWFRQPSRMLLVTDFCFALLAALGLHGLIAAESPMRGRRTSLVLSLTLLPVLGYLAVTPPVGWTSPSRIAVLALATTAALMATTRAGLAWRRVAGGVLVALVAVELVLAPAWFVRFPYDDGAERLLHRHERFFEDLRARQGSARVWLYSSLPPLDFAPGLAAVYRVRALDAYEPVNHRRQAEYLTFLAQGSPEPVRPPWLFLGRAAPLATPPGRAPAAARRRLLDVAAVRFIALRAEERTQAGVHELIADAGLRPLPSQSEGLLLFENPNALPRAFVVHRTRPAPPAGELLARMSAPEFDPRVESYVEGDPGLPPVQEGTPAAPVVFLRDEEHVVELETVSAAPGVLVLADTHYPGWKATVDDAPSPILVANHLFRGVTVPAGRHRVRFSYRPESVVWGAIASVCGALALVGLGLVPRLRGGPPRGRKAVALTIDPK